MISKAGKVVSIFPNSEKTEKTLLTQIKQHSAAANTIPKQHQIGFREHYTTKHQLFRMIEGVHHDDISPKQLQPTCPVEASELLFRNKKYPGGSSRKITFVTTFVLYTHMYIPTSDISIPRNADISLFADVTAIIASSRKKFVFLDNLQ